MSPVWQRIVSTNPEERAGQRLTDLTRRVGAMERGSKTAAVQRGAAINQAGVSGSAATTLTTLATVTLNIPSTDSLLQLHYYLADFHVSVGTTTATLYLVEATDAPGGIALVSTTGTGAATAVPFFTPLSFGGQTYQGLPVGIILNSAGAFTAGAKTFTLAAKRTAGTGTWTATGVSMWLSVV